MLGGGPTGLPGGTGQSGRTFVSAQRWATIDKGCLCGSGEEDAGTGWCGRMKLYRPQLQDLGSHDRRSRGSG